MAKRPPRKLNDPSVERRIARVRLSLADLTRMMREHIGSRAEVLGINPLGNQVELIVASPHFARVEPGAPFPLAGLDDEPPAEEAPDDDAPA